MCAALYCSPNSYPRCSLPGETDIACATRLREGVCTKAPEHTVNIARGKRTGFGIDHPEGRHRAADLRRQILSYFQPMHRALGGYADKSLITAFLCRSDALSLIPQ